MLLSLVSSTYCLGMLSGYKDVLFLEQSILRIIGDLFSKKMLIYPLSDKRVVVRDNNNSYHHYITIVKSVASRTALWKTSVV